MDQNNNADDEKIIIRCEKCAQNLRVPKSKEMLHVACPTCRHTFDYQHHADQHINKADSVNDEKIIIQCEKCTQNLRVPKRKEVIHVTCTTCRHIFDYPYHVPDQAPISRPKRRLHPSLLIGILLLVILIAGYSGIRYFLDRQNYKEGHQAYQSADCTAAIQNFDSIINGWRLFEIGEYTALSKKERAECIPFQLAVNKQKKGDFSAALVAYADYVSAYNSNPLVEAARIKSRSLFKQSKLSALASQATCKKIDIFLEKDLVPQRDINMPYFYFTCGQVYEIANDLENSFTMYKALLIEYPHHLLSTKAEASLMENLVTCKETSSLQSNQLISNRIDFMPSIYYHCGQAYETANDLENSFTMYKTLLIEYPDHLLSTKAEASLMENLVTCKETSSLQSSQLISNRIDFMPSIYYHCGKYYEEKENWASAIPMYDNFLALYPNHLLASDVETRLARSIVEQAKASSAGNIPMPERSGSTGNSNTKVVIQNDSPQRLRIVFSGPESMVEELAACNLCTTYTITGPSYCPEDGPIGRYELKPGEYDIVVESVSETGITPWSGNWSLISGDEYSSCFFVMSTISP